MPKFSWTSRLAQNRVTLVLCLLVGFTLLHSLVVFGLRSAVEHKLSFWKTGPKQLSDYQRNSKDPLNNAAPFYRAAWELCAGGPQTTAVTALSNDMLQQVTSDPARAEAALAPFHPALELLAEGHKRTQCDYVFPYRSGFSAMVPNFLAIRTLSRVCTVRTILARNAQDWSLMSSSSAHALRFIRTLEPDNTLITAMIKVACTGIVLDGLEGVELRHYSTELRSEMELLEGSLESIWRRALDGERLSGIQLYAQLESESASLNALSTLDGTARSQFTELAYRLGGKPLLLVDELVYLSTLQTQERDIHARPHTFPFLIASTLTFNAGRAHANLEKLRARLQGLMR